MRRWRWGLAIALPIGIGLLLGNIFWRSLLPNPVLYARADLGTLALLLGVALALGLGLEGVRRLSANRRQHLMIARLQAQAANERHGFLRRLDHELKNPLMAMRAGLANLAGTPLEATQREILSSVDAQTLRLSRLLADLRKLAELETRPLDFAPVDLGELLQEVVTTSEERPEAEGRHLALTLPQAPWPLPAISGDHDLLFLLFHNLLDNALKFTRPGNTIELRAYEDSSSVVVEVADTGPGIPEREVPLVWEELYRGEGARGVPGSGLGLALVRAIVGRHNGQIALRSRMGQGTVFTLRLPVR